MTASMPLRHFLRRVSMLELVAMFFNDPTTLLNTIFTIPFLRAKRLLANEAYSQSVTMSRGVTP